MWKLIREDLRELTSNRWKTFGMFLLLLLPALYASIFISAFQNPIHNSDNANIKVVSLDNQDLSNKVKKSMVGKHKINLHVDEYNMTIKDATDVYETREAAENAVKEGVIDGVFIIPKGFDSEMRIAALQIIENVITNKSNAFENVKLPTINFYTSYKRNYVSARLQGMRADIVTLKSQFISGTLKQIIKEKSQQKGIPFDAILVGLNIEEKIKTFKDGFIQFETIGGREINDYGNALYPYFFSIALWAGCLMMIFMYKNRRVGPIAQKAGTFKNYFAKTILWVSTAMMQSLLMSTLCLAIGLKVESPGYLIGYTLFVSIIFALICQGISSIFRVGEVGSFMVLIILIIQLSVSSGVFPVTMQAPAWGKMAPLVPFTYTIASFRELFVDTNNVVVWLHQWPIFIYLGFIPLSLTVNYFADKKRFKKYGHYTSHDPDVHDEH
ncbi:MAG: ABC transporter permease [Mycoplasmatales bacterium]|nr:ABC transporter permease [Mycoplasmatales bacterium]